MSNNLEYICMDDDEIRFWKRMVVSSMSGGATSSMPADEIASAAMANANAGILLYRATLAKASHDAEALERNKREEEKRVALEEERKRDAERVAEEEKIAANRIMIRNALDAAPWVPSTTLGPDGEVRSYKREVTFENTVLFAKMRVGYTFGDILTLDNKGEWVISLALIGSNMVESGLWQYGTVPPNWAQVPEVPVKFSIEVTSPGKEQYTVNFSEDVVKVGTHSQARLCIDDRTVSRTHAYFDASTPDVTIVDLGAGSGTYVNGSKINKRVLCDGDRIHIGNTLLVFRGHKV